MTEERVDGPRLATAKDVPEILDLVDRCFGQPDGGMAAQWNHCYDESVPERHAVIVRDGQVVSQIAIVEDELVVGDGRLRTWGVTGVATDPRYRGNGYMTQLLEFWLNRMDEENIPLSKLGGNRQLYGQYGWERAGRERRYRVTEQSFLNPPNRDGYIERYDGSEAATKFVAQLYRTKRYRVHRDAEMFRDRFGRQQLETLLYTEADHEAYLTFTRKREDSSMSEITEVAGTERGIRALLAHVFRVFGKDTLLVRLHPSDRLHSLFGSCNVSTNWEITPHRSINIRSLFAVLSAFEPQLTTRWHNAGNGTGSLTLSIDNIDETVELSWSDANVDVTTTDVTPEISFDQLEMTRLLFGYPETVEGYDGHPFLEAVLPLEFYIPRADQV